MPPMAAETPGTQLDPRRWWTLGFALLTVVVTVIDNTVFPFAFMTTS